MNRVHKNTGTSYFLLAGVLFVNLLFGPSVNAFGADSVGDNKRVLRVAYFAPSDREPEPEFQVRLDRVMTNIQAFYREGMRKNGFGPMTFELDRKPDGQLNIIMVKGAAPMLEYGRESQNQVRDEVRKEFAAQKLDFDSEVVIVFQALLQREPGRTTEIGAFKGGGNGFRGSAVVYDDMRLDVVHLASVQPDPFSANNKTLGNFNTGYIGGAAHELGHALGLSHDAEREMFRERFGRSLMGRGNHDYGEDLRGESRGAFLSAASAFPLTFHPLFTRKGGDGSKVEFEMVALKATLTKTGFKIIGKVKGEKKPVGIVAFNDPESDPSNYDAVGWPAKVKPDGSFLLNILDLMPGGYGLQFRVYAETGRYDDLVFKYSVDPSGRVDTSQLKATEKPSD
jgi:hypothetical protein